MLSIVPTGKISMGTARFRGSELGNRMPFSATPTYRSLSPRTVAYLLSTSDAPTTNFNALAASPAPARLMSSLLMES